MNKYIYRYCGLRLCSDFPLPELTMIVEEDGIQPDLDIRRALVPRTLSNVVHRTDTYEHNGRESLWRLSGVAHYRVSAGGKLIEVEQEPHADEASMRLFLLQPVFALACVMRGDWLLAAAAVEHDGRICAFVGPCASGKSTAVAILLQQGYRLVSDSLLRVTYNADGCMLAYPQASWLCLWPDAIENLGFNAASIYPVRPGIALQRLSWPAIEKPLPLARITILREQNDGDFELLESSPRKGRHALEILLNYTSGLTWLKTFGDHRRLFFLSTQTAKVSKIECLEIPWGWEHITQFRDQLDGWCREVTHVAIPITEFSKGVFP